jgi:hypothetical protein
MSYNLWNLITLVAVFIIKLLYILTNNNNNNNSHQYEIITLDLKSIRLDNNIIKYFSFNKIIYIFPLIQWCYMATSKTVPLSIYKLLLS